MISFSIAKFLVLSLEKKVGGVGWRKVQRPK